MARPRSSGNTPNPSTKKRRIAQYEHPDKERVKNPPVGLITPETVSLPFEKGKNGRVAVKIVDDRGIESLRIVEVA